MHSSGCRLTCNYKFLKGLDVAVMLTCVSLFSHDKQSQHCIHVSTKGPPAAPRHSLQRERKRPHAQDSQAAITWDGGGVSKSPHSPLCPVLSCHISFLDIL